jgi:hypothetical protein
MSEPELGGSVMSDTRARVAGRCPACGCDGTLFVANGGYITCSLDKCPDPTLVADVLSPQSSHSIVLTADIVGVCDEVERLSKKLASGINLTRGIPTNSPGTKATA